MKRCLLASTMIVGLGFGATAAPAEAPTRVLTLRYERPGVTCIPIVVGGMCSVNGARPNPEIRRDEGRVRVSVKDDLGFPVYAYVYDTFPDGTGEADTCGPDGIAETDVTPGASLWIDVYLDPIRGCRGFPASIAKSGTITVEFYKQ